MRLRDHDPLPEITPEGDDTPSGILLGHLIFGLAGGCIGFGLAHLPGWAQAVCTAALRVLP